jgi:hypothetical protein
VDKPETVDKEDPRPPEPAVHPLMRTLRPAVAPKKKPKQTMATAKVSAELPDIGPMADTSITKKKRGPGKAPKKPDVVYTPNQTRPPAWDLETTYAIIREWAKKPADEIDQTVNDPSTDKDGNPYPRTQR